MYHKFKRITQMKRFILINTIISVVLILLSFNLDVAFVHFLLVGEIPGTSLVVSPSFMLFGSFLLFTALVAAILRSLGSPAKKQSHA